MPHILRVCLEFFKIPWIFHSVHTMATPEFLRWFVRNSRPKTEAFSPIPQTFIPLFNIPDILLLANLSPSVLNVGYHNASIPNSLLTILNHSFAILNKSSNGKRIIYSKAVHHKRTGIFRTIRELIDWAIHHRSGSSAGGWGRPNCGQLPTDHCLHPGWSGV